MYFYSGLRVQNLGSSELSSQSFILSQYLEDGIHFPLEQANSDNEHPIRGSLMSSLYAAAVPRTSTSCVVDVLVLLPFTFLLEYGDVVIGAGVVNVENDVI